jgi:DNA-binding response OmpR family regulator
MVHMPETIHVLVVEDDAPIALMLQTVLEMEDYRVTCAGTAAEARDVFLHHSRAVGENKEPLCPISLMLLDLQLPDMDGAQLVCQLRERAVVLPPVIVTSAQPQPIVKRMADEVGAAAVVNKPYQVQDLLTTMRNVLDRETVE